jgi:hypothetical protein
MSKRKSLNSLAALTAAIIAMVVFAPVQASAEPTVIKRSIGSSLEYAIDGSDFYFVRRSSGLKKGSRPGVDQLMRGSFLNKSVKVVAKVAWRNGFLDTIYASGGFVFANVQEDAFGKGGELAGSKTRIVRYSRDGTDVRTVAKGEAVADEQNGIVTENGKKKLNDCGVQVEAAAAGPAGAIIVTQTTSDRGSKACGHKKNVDHLRYYELKPDGATREVFSLDKKVTRNANPREETLVSTFVTGGPNLFQLVGDHVTFMYGSRGDLWVKNLATGFLSGPYTALPGKKSSFQFGSLDPVGRLASVSINFESASKKNPVGTVGSAVFTNPDDPSSIKELSNKSWPLYCGNRLLLLGEKSIVEVDPVTFVLLRKLYSFPPKGNVDIERACSQDYLYLNWYGSKNGDLDQKLYAVPLG